jgi:hypothetical protein
MVKCLCNGNKIKKLPWKSLKYQAPAWVNSERLAGILPPVNHTIFNKTKNRLTCTMDLLVFITTTNYTATFR